MTKLGYTHIDSNVRSCPKAGIAAVVRRDSDIAR